MVASRGPERVLDNLFWVELLVPKQEKIIHSSRKGSLSSAFSGIFEVQF